MKNLPQSPMLWAWVDFEEVRQIDGFKNGLDGAALDPGATLCLADPVDVVRRTPYMISSIAMEGPNFVLEHRMPVGRLGMASRAELFQARDGKGALPLLQTPGISASIS